MMLRRRAQAVVQAENIAARSPLIEAWKTQMKNFLLVVGMRFADDAVLYIPVVFTLSYLKLQGYPGDVGLVGVFLAAAAQVFSFPSLDRCPIVSAGVP